MSKTLSLLPAALCVAVVSLGEPTRTLKAATSPAERKIEQALASPTELEFIETPLEDAISYLSDYHEIPIRIDRKALEEIGVGQDSTVTERLRGISMGSALTLMLRELELTYLIENEVLSITTIEAAQTRLTTKVYPVTDLLTRSDRPDGGDPADFDTMIELITATVAPETWDEAGGPGSIRGVALRNVQTLVVSQTYHGHRRIAALLDELRRVTGAEPSPAGPAAVPAIEPAVRSAAHEEEQPASVDPFDKPDDEPADEPDDVDPFALPATKSADDQPQSDPFDR